MKSNNPIFSTAVFCNEKSDNFSPQQNKSFSLARHWKKSTTYKKTNYLLNLNTEPTIPKKVSTRRRRKTSVNSVFAAISFHGIDFRNKLKVHTHSHTHTSSKVPLPHTPTLEKTLTTLLCVSIAKLFRLSHTHTIKIALLLH